MKKIQHVIIIFIKLYTININEIVYILETKIICVTYVEFP